MVEKGGEREGEGKGEVVISDYVRVTKMPGFSCTLCGDCCRNRVIPLYEEDIERLKSAGYEDFYESTDSIEFELTGAPYKMKLRKDGSCIFLEDNMCSVYEIRPDTCRRYPFIVGEDFILVSLSCPGIKWDEEGDPRPYKEASRKIAGKIRALME